MGTKKQEMTQAQFDQTLRRIVDAEPAHNLLGVEGVLILVSECYRNRVSREWQEEQRLARAAWATLTDRLAGPRLRWVREQLRDYDIDTRMLCGALQVPLKKLGPAMEVLVEKYGVRRVIDMADDDVMFGHDDEDEEG